MNTNNYCHLSSVTSPKHLYLPHHSPTSPTSHYHISTSHISTSHISPTSHYHISSTSHYHLPTSHYHLPTSHYHISPHHTTTHTTTSLPPTSPPHLPLHKYYNLNLVLHVYTTSLPLPPPPCSFPTFPLTAGPLWLLMAAQYPSCATSMTSTGPFCLQ